MKKGTLCTQSNAIRHELTYADQPAISQVLSSQRPSSSLEFHYWAILVDAGHPYSRCSTTVKAMNISMAVLSHGYSLKRIVT